MSNTRTPHVVTERFLQPIFDEETGAVRTTRMVEPGERADLTVAEALALGGKARVQVAGPPVDVPAPGGPPDGGA
jgi:hypothetical protein